MKRTSPRRGNRPAPLLYLQGTSFLHGLHPFTKFIFVIVVSTSVLLVNSVIVLGGVVIALGALVKLNGLPALAALRYFKWIMILAVSLVPLDMLLNPVLLPGQEAFVVLAPPFFPLRRLTVHVAARSFSWVACFSISNALLVFTTKPRDFVVGLMEARVPQSIAFGISIALRYVPLIQHDMNVIGVAQRVRGRSRSSVHGLRDAIDYVREQVSTGLVAIFRHAFHTSVSMEKRAFRLHPTRTVTYSLGFCRRDAAFLAITIACFTLLVLHAWNVLPLPPVPSLFSLLGR